MAIVLTDAYIRVGTVVLEEEGSAVALSYSAAPVEVGVMGARNIKRYAGEAAPLDWSAEIEVVLDEVKHGAAFFGMVGEVVEIEVRPKNAAIGAGNPAYVGEAILTDYQPLGSGQWGELVQVSLSFVGAGDLLRLTTAPTVAPEE
jgi:hypothetical protein